MTNVPIKKRLEANQKQIVDLATAIRLWISTPSAQNKEVRSKVKELEDRLVFRLRELEEQGQLVKIENMQKVLDILKSGAEPNFAKS